MPAPAPVDMEAALSQHANLALVWHLLYDATWQLPTQELEAAWRDALGETDPMQARGSAKCVWNNCIFGVVGVGLAARSGAGGGLEACAGQDRPHSVHFLLSCSHSEGE
jgi:hypothetical protein